MYEYAIVNALGDGNVSKAIEDKMAENMGWKVHTLIPVGAAQITISELTQEQMVVPNFMLLFEREVNDPFRPKIS